MVDAVGSLTKIMEIVLKIKDVVETVKLNETVCRETRDRANRLSYILSCLNDTENKDHPVMRPTLIAFEKSLVRALDLVTSCQEKTIIIRLFKATLLSKQLDRVKTEISELVMEANLAFLSVPHGTVRLVCPTPQEEATVAESGSINICVGVNMGAAQSSSRIRIFSLPELKYATDNFSQNSIIGKSGDTTVYKGEFSDKLVAAIRRFDDPETQAPVFRVQLQHKNVLRCMGYCHEDSQDMVVEEYAPKGTLSDIFNDFSKQLNWSSAFKIIQGVAEGVAYLHLNRVIHLDLKPDNIVFDIDMNPKICDFTKSKVINQDVTEEETPELVGTLGYIPPEYIVNGIISLKSDVFSFGVVLLHTIKRMIKTELETHPIIWAWEMREDQRMNVLFEPSSHDVKEVKKFIEIGLLCTQEVPEERPSMAHVLEMLNGEDNMNNPTKPGFAKDIKRRCEHKKECATIDLESSR